MKTQSQMHVSRLLKGTAVLGTVAVLVSGCGSDAPETSLTAEVDYAPASLQEAVAVEEVVAATTRLGVELQIHQGQEGQNSVVSPASISVAFALLAEGATGAAAQELGTWLGASGHERTEAFSALQAAVLQFDGNPDVVQQDELPARPLLHLANQLTVREQGGVKEEYLTTLGQWYDAGIDEADFTSESAKNALDDWVKYHTGGLIEESAIEPDGQTLAVIQNAILLAAQWQNPFDAAVTAPSDFVKTDGDTVQVDSMRQSIQADYVEYDGGQVIRLPYTEGFAMDVVLPEQGRAPELISAEDWDEISALFATNSEMTDVDLLLPLLDLETPAEKVDLLPFLEEQGLEATLAGDTLDGVMESDLWIDAVGHQALLRVDEEGTLGAAVTEVEIAEISAPIPDESALSMHVDRPFALRVVHLDTQWPLFMATVHDPAAESGL